jgi:hypothetical protein
MPALKGGAAIKMPFCNELLMFNRKPAWCNGQGDLPKAKIILISLQYSGSETIQGSRFEEQELLQARSNKN